MPFWGKVLVFASLPLGAVATYALLAVRCSPLGARNYREQGS
ncbi:hypothetical protein [Micromonospora maritima]|nr:hypothetical protein [Micromonospora maritima]